MTFRPEYANHATLQAPACGRAPRRADSPKHGDTPRD